jgi:hypothetical protein
MKQTGSGFLRNPGDHRSRWSWVLAPLPPNLEKLCVITSGQSSEKPGGAMAFPHGWSVGDVQVS